MNSPVTKAAINSAAIREYHIPSMPQIIGNSKTAEIWKTRVRKNEIKAEVRPSFSAVKNDEPKMAMPANKNENENITKP